MQGSLVFDEGQEISNITLNIWKRFEFESSSEFEEASSEDTVFVMKLLYPTDRAEIGDRDHVIIHYFDSYDLADTRNTYALFNGLRSTVTRIFGQFLILDYGKVYTLDIYSFYLASMPKIYGETEIYYLIQYDQQKKQIRDVSQSVHIDANHH